MLDINQTEPSLLHYFGPTYHMAERSARSSQQRAQQPPHEQRRRGLDMRVEPLARGEAARGGGGGAF